MGSSDLPKYAASSERGVVSMSLGFLAIGPQRTGTSWMDAALRTHPDVQLPSRVKETFFFDRNLGNGPTWYDAQFGQERELLRGEIGPTYFESPGALDAIGALANHPRIIVTVRHPIERSISSFRHHVRAGRVSGSSLRAAVDLVPSILEASRYSSHLPRWQRAFGAQQVLILPTDLIDSEPEAAYVDICQYLGLDLASLPSLPDRTYLGATSEMPRFPLLARFATQAAGRMRSLGLHSVVNLGKQSGLKRVFRGGGRYPDISESDIEWLEETLASEVAYASEILGRDW